MKTGTTSTTSTRLEVEHVPATVTNGGRESHVLEILTVVE